MARYGTLKRNIKRNIRSWSEYEATKTRGDIVVMSKVVAVFIALSLAISFVPVAVKVIFSIPDLYSFDLGRTQAVKEAGIATEKAGIDAEGDRIADMISSFMMHKTDNFQIASDGGDEDASPESPESTALVSTPIFTVNDGEVMTTLRAFLDNILIIGLTALAVFIALCVILVRWDRPRELRHGFTGGFVLYGVFIGFFAVALVLKWPYATAIWTDVIGARFTPDDMMPKLFQGGLFLTSWMAVTVVTFVIMLVLTSVIGRLARHERMFRGKK
jgi:hypothetical protein